MEIIEQVRQASSIVEIAGQYTALKHRGRKWVGLCPFHSEKGPSFTVDEEKQLYHCFGCGAGGDVFSLVMEKENLNFPEALRYLAEKYRIPLPEQRLNPEILKLEEKLFKINDQALAMFRRNLAQTSEGRTAAAYLKKRGLSEDTVQTLKLGYAMNSWDALRDFFQSKGVPVSLLEKAGLVLPGKKPGEFYDRFRGRVIFPIFSLTGKVVAFGGRDVVNGEPKYLNSPDTPLYSKGKLLYGLNFSKDAVREAGEAILVEGYTDFSALYQAGVRNVFASLGTALTPFQVAQAARFASRIVVNYDGDAAGRSAAARAVPLCFEKGINVRVLILPEDLDPDAYLKKHGRDRYLALFKRTSSGLKFLIDAYSQGSRPDVPEDKARVARAVVKEIEKIPDAMAQSEYLSQASALLKIDENTLRRIVDSRSPNRAGGERTFLQNAEKRLLQILMEDRAMAVQIFADDGEDVFRGLRSEVVFHYIHECFQNDKTWSFTEMRDRIPPLLASQISEILLEKTCGVSAKETAECLIALKKLRLQSRLKEIQAEIVDLEKRGEKEDLLPLLYEKQGITKQILSL
jgi:DNA primase